MWLYLDVNPEPWAIGPLSIGKRNGKMFPKVGQNSQLAAFKSAVAEAIKSAGVVEPVPYDTYDLTFLFWRRLDDYETETGRRHRKHQVDATNLQKATEDALQGVLIGNDRDVLHVESEIIEQSADAIPGIAIQVETHAHKTYSSEMWSMREHAVNEYEIQDYGSDNSWPPK